MANRTRILASLLLVAAACGDDSNSNTDGGGDGGTCSTAPLTIATVPGMVSGTVKGGGADLDSPEGSCTDEFGWYSPKGEDTIVAINGLTVGMKYGVTLQSESDDLSLYITASCPPTTGMVTGCSTFTDEAVVFLTNDPEVITFTATASTHYIVVDTGTAAADLTDGNFTLEVTNATCGPQTEATDCSGGTPYCVDFGCKQCVSGFDCAAGTPSCDSGNTCVAGPAQCTGDDARDSGAGDDGPSVASVITAPTLLATPTVVNGGICSTPGTEEDWFKIDLTTDVSVSLTFTGATNDLDVYLLDNTNTIVAGGAENAGINELFLTEDIKAGTYYLLVLQYAPANTAAAVPYVLTVSLPECDPSEFSLLSCTTAAKPVCNEGGQCAAGPATCVGDTAGEPNDDGPAGARTLTNNTAVTGEACTGSGEFDYYKFTVTAGQGETLTLDWTDATQDFDLQVSDATGKAYGFSFNAKPEVVTLTHLPAGTYYARVSNFAQQAGTASAAYTITGSTTAVVACTTSTQCASEHKTQIYRGVCTPATDVCSFIPDAKAVAVAGACDSDGDCAGTAVCSYATFQSNAQASVCGPMTCASTADCTAAGANMKCTTFSSGNTCMPSCAANTDCGASNGSTLEPGFPWDYFTCTTAAGTCGP